MAYIEIIELCKSFGKKRVLRGVNLSVEKGETLVIIGGSGTGKSVLMKHIVGLIKPDSGDIVVDGESIVKMGKRELLNKMRKFAYVFQGAALFDSLNVGDNIAFGLRRFFNYSDEVIDSIIKDSLESVGLFNVEEKMPSELSGGMKKRVGLARAIALKPEIILYDEPTTGLDPVMSDSISKLILQINKKYKVTSLVITHDMKSAFTIADRIAMLYKGEIIGIGNVEEIKNNSNPIIKQFIEGSSEGPIQF